MDQSFGSIDERINDLEALRFRIFKSQALFECLAIKIALGGGFPGELDGLRTRNEIRMDLLRTEVEFLKLKNQIGLLEQDHEKIYDYTVTVFQ